MERGFAGLLVALSGCVGINPDYDGAEGGATGSASAGTGDATNAATPDMTDAGGGQEGGSGENGISGGSDSGGTTADAPMDTDSAGDSEGTTTGPFDACLEGAPPTEDCALAGCSDCIDGTCVVDCIGEDACRNEVVDCAPGMPCEVLCESNDACRNAEINCPEGHGCTIQCRGKHVCENTIVRCGGGPCNIHCHDPVMHNCEELEVVGGTAQTAVTCAQPEPIILDCTNSNGCPCGTDPSCE